MSVIRFTGVNSRDAMRRVRDALGDDALILANRRTEKGFEILAMAEEHAVAAAQAPEALPPAVPSSAKAPAEPTPDPQLERRPLRLASPSEVVDDAPVKHAPRPAGPPTEPLEQDFAALGKRLLGEMQEMRTLLDRPRVAPGEKSLTAQLMQELHNAGFSKPLADSLLTGLPPELADAPTRIAEGREWLMQRLTRRLSHETAHDPFSAGGIVALVGPTGVGKTTTTAKLAARQVMRLGADAVALVSTDSYRIGAHEQLRIYAELLGVSLLTVDSDTPLETLLPRLADKQMVIVDTVGMSQRDARLVDQLESLHATGRPLHLLLLLNAGSQGETLEEVVTTYQRAASAAGHPLRDAMLTKHDEAARLAPVLDVVIRHGLRLHYVSHGQRVPEDLSPVQADTLAQQALAQGTEHADSTWHSGAEAPRLSRLSRQLLGQGRNLATLWQTLRREVPGFSALEAAWELTDLPADRQGDSLARLQERPAGARCLLWARPGPARGQTWAMPALWLTEEGMPCGLPLLQHQQPAGWPERLAWSSDWQPRLHILPSLPDAETRRRLDSDGCAWLSHASPLNRLWHAGARQPIRELAPLATWQDQQQTVLRQQPLLADLHHLSLPQGLSPGQSEGSPLAAWYGRLTHAESGKIASERYWVASATAPSALTPLLGRLVMLDTMTTLTARADKALAETPLGELDRNWRLAMAAGLAGLACHLTATQASWAMDLRGELLALNGSRRRAGTQAMLDGLILLFLVEDTFVNLGTQWRGGSAHGS